jgi:hypothetical protein
LQRVPSQVHHHLYEPVRIGANARQVRRQLEVQLDPFGLETRREPAGRQLDDAGYLQWLKVEVIGAGFDPAELLQVVHQARQPAGLLINLLIGGLVRGQHAVDQSFHRALD